MCIYIIYAHIPFSFSTIDIILCPLERRVKSKSLDVQALAIFCLYTALILELLSNACELEFTLSINSVFCDDLIKSKFRFRFTC